MARIINFIKTTALGGLLLIVPLAVLGIALGYLFGLLIQLNEFIAEHLPYEFFGHPMVVIVLAVLSIILICFVAGLIVRTSFGGGIADRLNKLFLDKLPMYGLIRSMTRRFSGDEVLEFTPAEVDLHGTGAISLAFVMEELPDNRYAVFVPSTPAITVGRLYLIESDKIKLLDIPPKLAIDAITQWGSGAKLMYEGEAAKGNSAASQ